MFISGGKGKSQLRKRRSRHPRTDCQGETTTEEPWSDQQYCSDFMSLPTSVEPGETTVEEPGENTSEEPWSDQQYCSDFMSLPTSVEPGETTVEEPGENTSEEPWSDQQYCSDFMSLPTGVQQGETTIEEPGETTIDEPLFITGVKGKRQLCKRRSRHPRFNCQGERTTEEPWSDQEAEETFTAEPWSDQQYCPDIKFDVKASEGHAIVRKTKRNTYVYNTRYTCNLCGRKFPFKCKLEEHQRIHTGQKPFVCTICSNTFTQKSSLTRHYVKIHRFLQ